jgi:hypothetical protein
MIETSRLLRQTQALALATGVILSVALAGCSSAIDHIPTSLGGLPEGVPQRPAVQPAYPAVHDMPPARQDATLSDAERKRLQEDLARARDRAAPPADAPGAAAGAPRNP